MRAAAALAALILLALVAGCGGDGAVQRTEPPPPPSGTGYFVGAQDGIGATLDMVGDDPVSRKVSRALVADAGAADALPAVGIASIVNETSSGFDRPAFIAILETGRAVILEPAMDALRTERGPAAREARAALRDVPSRIPSEGAGVAYVVLRGVPSDQVKSVTMAAGPEPAITLAARRR